MTEEVKILRDGLKKIANPGSGPWQPMDIARETLAKADAIQPITISEPDHIDHCRIAAPHCGDICTCDKADLDKGAGDGWSRADNTQLAPGVHVLGYNKSRPECGFTEVWLNGAFEWCARGGWITLTHWQRLPEAPK